MENPEQTIAIRNVDDQSLRATLSPFLQPMARSASGSLAVLHLRRDQLTPVILSELDEANEGYEEGKVTNTRFGSFPHTTLIDVPWGSQVRASKVDTGSRGRKAGSKRKRDEATDTAVAVAAASDPSTPTSEITSAPKAAVVAQTGFAHLLPPTPEAWTISLPHRTQVVYTPDYSLILHRLRARPGTHLIEAGAGSGSFSHAAARAVHGQSTGSASKRDGKVWSFEFHERRVEKLQEEISSHGLDGIVQVTHRDVYENGFNVYTDGEQQAVHASAVFLDLPAPWLALPHLTRTRKSPQAHDEQNGTGSEDRTALIHGGPLAPDHPVHICCFLPCIEQVQRAVAALRQHSWQHINVVNVAAHRIEVRRERIGINEEGLRGVNAVPANVEEAMTKIKDDESRTQVFHEISQRLANGEQRSDIDRNGVRTRHERLKDIQEASEHRKLYKEGRLVHRAEPELKTHTSYLIFAVLPREWSEEEETQAKAKWDGVAAAARNDNRKSKGKGGRVSDRKESKRAAEEITKPEANDKDPGEATPVNISST